MQSIGPKVRTIPLPKPLAIALRALQVEENDAVGNRGLGSGHCSDRGGALGRGGAYRDGRRVV